MFLRGRHRRPGVHQQVSPRINSQQLQSRNRYTNRRFARFGIFVLALVVAVPVFLLNPFRNNAVVTSDPSNAVQPLLNTDTDYDQQSKIVEQPSASLTLAGQMEWIQNEFRAADPNDWWAHIRYFPSAHAIIRNPSGKRIPRAVIKRACCVIKSRSNQCKSVKGLEFDVTRIQNVTPTDTPGLVTLKGQPTLVTI